MTAPDPIICETFAPLPIGGETATVDWDTCPRLAIQPSTRRVMFAPGTSFPDGLVVLLGGDPA